MISNREPVSTRDTAARTVTAAVSLLALGAVIGCAPGRTTGGGNPTPGNNLDFLYSQTSVGLQWIAAKRVTVMADYTYSRLRSDITYLIPQTLTSADSVYRDNANTVTGMIEGTPVTGAHTPRLSAGGSYFKSNGTRPTA